MSSSPNPLDSVLVRNADSAPPPPSSSFPEGHRNGENPPWNGWDILVLIGVTIGASFLCGMAVMLAAKLLLYADMPWGTLARKPELLLFAQLLAYVVVFAVMYAVVATRVGQFWSPVRWVWPKRWAAYLFGGAILYLVLAGVGQLLPIPKHLPIDRFFANSREAALMSIFAVSLAPLMEELFFRGFLYPVLARRWGIMVSVLITSAAFGILHGAQLKYSWAVLIIFLVGVALTMVRAVTRSTAASFLVHVGYNGTLSLLLYLATDGFRHLEKISQ